MSQFVSRNKPLWQELEGLVKRAQKAAGKMSAEELCRLDVLYRRTAVHLAQVATRTSDRGLTRYLNDLTAAAHSVIYLPPRRSALAGAANFLAVGFARSIVRNWRFHAISCGLLLGGAAVAFFLSLNDLLAAYALMPPGDVRTPGSTPEQLLAVLRSGRDSGGDTKFAFASFLFSHNLQVGLLALAAGVLAAVPTVILMTYNGMLLGAFAAMHYRADIHAEFWAWILPHGVTELFAVVLCGGVGMMLGSAVLAPQWSTRGDSLRRAGRQAAMTAIGVAAMLIVAAIVESYLRQSHLSTAGRLLFAAASALFWIVYLANGYFAERRDRLQPVAAA